jgi:hypothetical protein
MQELVNQKFSTYSALFTRGCTVTYVGGRCTALLPPPQKKILVLVRYLTFSNGDGSCSMEWPGGLSQLFSAHTYLSSALW